MYFLFCEALFGMTAVIVGLIIKRKDFRWINLIAAGNIHTIDIHSIRI